MIYKDSKENLLKEGLIKKCPVDWRAINNLIKRAYRDIETAKKVSLKFPFARRFYTKL